MIRDEPVGTRGSRAMIELVSAMAALDGAIEHARELGIRVTAVVLDSGGHPVSLRRMDGAPLSSVTIAEKKAYTAISFRAPTHSLAERIPPDFHGPLSMADSRLTFLSGGVPIVDNEQVTGGIGVSGGSADQDVACCEAALRRIA
jgi:uncharacterized protein GlcG (DUF336 family)